MPPLRSRTVTHGVTHGRNMAGAPVSAARPVYAAMATSASAGAARDTTLIAHPDQ